MTDNEIGTYTMPLHEREYNLIRFIRDLGHGEIERLKVHDGLPMCAEKVIDKTDFGKPGCL